MNYMKESKLSEKEKSSTKSGGEKKTKDEKIGLGSYLKEYLVECDFNKKKIDEDIDNDDKNSVNLYNNESYLPYLVNLINEKNKFIEELKSSLISLNTKYSESESNYKKEIEKLATEINRKEDKIKVLSEGDKFELIDFYENEIVQITGKYDSFCDIIRASLEGTQTSQGLINEKKNNDSQKNIINGLLNENSKLNNTVNKLKYLERMSKVYKSLIFRFGNKIELNQKTYDDLFNKYSNIKTHLQNLEKEKKTLEETVTELNKVQHNPNEEKISFVKTKSHSESKETSDKFKNIKGSDFIKVINQERIVFTKYIDEAKEVFAKINLKIESLENTLKFYFKKNLNIEKEKLEIIEKEIKSFLLKCEDYYQQNMTLYSIITDIKSKIKLCKEKNDFSIIEDILDKLVINLFFNNK